jgi:hypothetical protein
MDFHILIIIGLSLFFAFLLFQLYEYRYTNINCKKCTSQDDGDFALVKNQTIVDDSDSESGVSS